MSQPTKNADRKKERDVVIAAQSTLDAVKEAARELEVASAEDSAGEELADAAPAPEESRESAQKIPLIMGALEKLASATDLMAQQLGDRLEEVRIELTQDLQDARSSDLRHVLAERLETITERLDTMASEWQQVRQEGDGTTRDVSEDLTALGERVQEIATQLEQVVGLVDAKSEAITARVNDARDEIREEVQSIRRDLHDDLDELRNGLLDSLAAQFATIQTEIERNRTETAKGQRAAVADLAEGIGLAQTASEKRFDQIESEMGSARQQSREDFAQWQAHSQEELAKWQAESREHFERWTREQAERLAGVERESLQIGDLGRRLERNHAEMMQLFEQEKQRATQIEHERQREAARRANNSGVARYHSGDFDRARELFEQAVELDQNFAEAFNNLGLCLTELGEHDEATVAFEAAIELNPDLGASYNNLGYVLYLQENFEAAIEMYKEAIGRQHDTSAAYTNLGNAYQKLEHTEKAVDAWRQALEVDPTNERAQQYLDRFAGGIAK